VTEPDPADPDRTEPDLTDPGCYHHWIDEHVRFSDTDAVGHVNNVAFTAYIESGRVAYAFDLAARVGDAGLTAMVLRRLEVDYLSEAHYPADLRVGSRLLHVGRTSLVVGTGAFVGDRCVCTARNVLVVVGADGPAPIPDAARPLLDEELRR
jgi:acyl-CoA thioester hydrolase